VQAKHGSTFFVLVGFFWWWMNSATKAARWSLGLLFIAAVVVIWTLSSVLVQYIYVSLSFDSPFLLTYLCSTLFLVYLPPHAARATVGWCRAQQRGTDEVQFQPLPTAEDSDEDIDGGAAPAAEDIDGGAAPAAERQRAAPRLNTVQTLRAAAFVVTPWFLAQYTYNASLRFTSITSNTVISTSSSLYTFLFGLAFLGEKFTWGKMAALLGVLGGAAVTCIGDHMNGGDEFSDTLWGDAVCLLSALLYGAYTTALRKCVPDDDACSMTLLFGFIGLLSLVVVGPAVFALHEVAGHHAWLNHTKSKAAALVALPPLTASALSPLALWQHLVSVPAIILGAVVIKGMFQNVLADYLWARSIVLTSPTVGGRARAHPCFLVLLLAHSFLLYLFPNHLVAHRPATMGLSMTIPAAMVADFALGKGRPTPHALVGAALMLGGFTLYNRMVRREEQAAVAAAADKAALRKRAGASEVGGIELPVAIYMAAGEAEADWAGDNVDDDEAESVPGEFDEIDIDDL
jgi:solute carrier family 35, member F5